MPRGLPVTKRQLDIVSKRGTLCQWVIPFVLNHARVGLSQLVQLIESFLESARVFFGQDLLGNSGDKQVSLAPESARLASNQAGVEHQ